MEFKIGDRVYCSDKKVKGIVKSINRNVTAEYAVSVNFDNGMEDTYTKTGKRLISGNRVLSKAEEQATTTEPNSEIIPGLGKVFILSCGTRILKTLENTHIILPQTPKL